MVLRKSSALCWLCPRRCNRGFTLIELVVVIIIMAVLSAIAVPSYTRLHARAKFDGGVQEVISLFRWAREMAVESGFETTVRFDQQSATFIATVQQMEPLMDAPTAVLEQQEREEQPITPPRIYEIGEDLAVADFQSYRESSTLESRQSFEDTLVRFLHDGSCDGARFVLVSSEGHRAIVEIAAPTGKPSIIEETE